MYLGGDLPWIKRLLGISTAPQVASPFNNAVRQHGDREYTGMDQLRTVESDAANLRRYESKEASSLAVAGCISPPLLRIDRAYVVFCLLHAVMALGRAVCAFVNRRARCLTPAKKSALQCVLDDNKTHFKVGSTAGPDGEDTCRILACWEDIAAHLEIGNKARRAVLDVRKMVSELYVTYQPHRPQSDYCKRVIRNFRKHVVRRRGGGGHYLLILEYDADRILANIFPYGLAMFCGDIVESLNRLLKKAYTGHSNRGGGGGHGTGLQPGSRRLRKSVGSQARVLLQCLAWIFLYFDIHLVSQNKPRPAACNAQAALEPSQWRLVQLMSSDLKPEVQA